MLDVLYIFGKMATVGSLTAWACNSFSLKFCGNIHGDRNQDGGWIWVGKSLRI